MDSIEKMEQSGFDGQNDQKMNKKSFFCRRCCCCLRFYKQQPLLAFTTTAVLGFFVMVLGFACAYAIFPAIIKSSVRSELNIWDKDTEGAKSFVRKFQTY